MIKLCKACHNKKYTNIIDLFYPICLYGYTDCWKDDCLECPCVECEHYQEVEDHSFTNIDISKEDYKIIIHRSNDMDFIDAMINLKKTAPIKYGIKMARILSFSNEAERRIRTEWNKKIKEANNPTLKCPKCGSVQIQMVPRKLIPLTGKFTNKVDMVCVNCKHKFKSMSPESNLPVRKKKKRLPLKTVYYRSFSCFIVIPILIVLLVSLLILNQQFKKQAIETILHAQETVLTELKSDIDIMSMRLSHMIYTNNNEILNYAAGTDTQETGQKYLYRQKLEQAGNLALEPVKDIISAGFYMKSGRESYIKNEINRSPDQIRSSGWYQAALKRPNTVCVGSYDTADLNDLFQGGRRDMLVLVFALAPDVTTDRSQKVEMAALYQSTDAAQRILENNAGYGAGKNKLGFTQIVNEDGDLIFSTLGHGEEEDRLFTSSGNTCVRTPLEFNGTVWYIESYISPFRLTADFWSVAAMVLGAAVLILLFAGFYSRYFLHSVVNPIEEVSGGLKQVEEGNLEVHIAPSGQYEIRTMIHAFNAMTRRLKALIAEYEQRVKNVEKSPADYFEALVTGSMSPEEVNRMSREFFMERYVLLYIWIETDRNGDSNSITGNPKLEQSFEHNPRFASRCVLYRKNSREFYVFYRITEEDYEPGLKGMLRQLQSGAVREYGAHLAVCIGSETFGFAGFTEQLRQVSEKICLRHLEGTDALISLQGHQAEADELLVMSRSYEKLASALYTADEKNMVQEREKLFEELKGQTQEAARRRVYAAIVAVGNRFSQDNSGFSEIFGQSCNYLDKVGRIDDLRSLKLWITNYFAWIMDYSASRLQVAQTDVILKAKRYIADYCEDADLSLARVAEYVGLNEKYFTNRFTRETGETFSAYLTGLRMQKARELLKTTSFKVYEIAEMSGYRNVEHFNRMFKKINKMTPAQYRKTM